MCVSVVVFLLASPLPFFLDVACTFISLAHCLITGPDIDVGEFCEFVDGGRDVPELQRLVLARNRVSNSGAQALAKLTFDLPAIRCLDVTACRITDFQLKVGGDRGGGGD